MGWGWGCLWSPHQVTLRILELWTVKPSGIIAFPKFKFQSSKNNCYHGNNNFHEQWFYTNFLGGSGDNLDFIIHCSLFIYTSNFYDLLILGSLGYHWNGIYFMASWKFIYNIITKLAKQSLYIAAVKQKHMHMFSITPFLALSLSCNVEKKGPFDVAWLFSLPSLSR